MNSLRITIYEQVLVFSKVADGQDIGTLNKNEFVSVVDEVPINGLLHVLTRFGVGWIFESLISK